MPKPEVRVVVPHPVAEPGPILFETHDRALYSLLLQLGYLIEDTAFQTRLRQLLEGEAVPRVRSTAPLEARPLRLRQAQRV